MSNTNPSCAAKNLTPVERKTIALQAITNDQNITQIAKANQVSRNFVYLQKDKAMQGIDDVFTTANDNDVLFYLPVTKKWLISFILCLILHCRSSYRGIYKLLTDAFDYNISIGTIHNIVQITAITAKKLNNQQDLTAITITAHDELFHNDKPILSGIDIPTLYCHLLAKENNRDGDTWAIHLLDLKNQAFKPSRVIADDGSGLRNGHALMNSIAHWDIPCDIDLFHVIRDLMEMRRYFRNKLKSTITLRKACELKLLNAATDEIEQKLSGQLTAITADEKLIYFLSTNIDTLVNWLEHDVFNKAGPNITIRRELYDFIVKELEILAKLHSHRILPICIKLEDIRDLLLAFVDVLTAKFTVIAKQYQCQISVVWELCKLQRCKYSSDNYIERSEKIELQLGSSFEEIEDAVLAALDSTERTSSMIENLNSRVRSYLFNRKTVDQNFLDLLRFYFNHTPFLRSERDYRVNKTPTELLTGKSHDNWLKLLGHHQFKRAA